MKKIPLTQGKFALIDNEDFERVNQFKWFYRSQGYAARGVTITINKKRTVKIIYLHRFILNIPNGLHTDHINGDGLDNRKNNLRACTIQQNNYNRRNTRKHSSLFRGVYKTDQKWSAQISYQGKDFHLGRYFTPEEAAKAYNIAAIKYFGEFARLNTL